MIFVTVVFRLKDKTSGDIIEFGQEEVNPDSILMVYMDKHFLKEKVPVGQAVDELVITFSGDVEFKIEK